MEWALTHPEAAFSVPTGATSDQILDGFLDDSGMKRGLLEHADLLDRIRAEFAFREEDQPFVLLMTLQASLDRALMEPRWQGDDLLARHLLTLGLAYGFDALTDAVMQDLTRDQPPDTDELCRLSAKLLDQERRRQRDPLFRFTLVAAVNLCRTVMMGRMAGHLAETGKPDMSKLPAIYYDGLEELKALLYGLIGLAWADGEVSPEERRFIRELVDLMKFESIDQSDLLAALDDPVDPKRWIARITQPDARRFLMEQLAVAALLDGRASPKEEAYLRLVASGLGFPDEEIERLQDEAAVFYAAHAKHLDSGWTGRLDRMTQRLFGRVKTAVVDNLDRLLEEIRQTKDLSVLLAQAARRDLTEEEKKRIKAQLTDICKTIPALAVFALPGGGVLLPILIKTLPFKILPSAFDD
jgi:hypothetical protein